MNRLNLKSYIIINYFNVDDNNSPVEDVSFDIVTAQIDGECDKDNTLRELLNSKKYVAKKDDILYFDSHCKVPRFKLKNVCEKYNLSITRDISKATKIFIADELISKNFKNTTYNTIGIDCFKEILNTIFPPDYEPANEIRDAVNTCTGMYVGFKYAARDIFNHVLVKPILAKYYPDTDDPSDYASDLETNDYYIIYDPSEDCKINIVEDDRIYLEDQIIKYLNQDNVMDNESYQNVLSLFQSSDTGNHMLAMEIMANCDFRKSAPYLLLLFENYRNLICNNPSRNHVNFRSFLRFFNLNLNRGYSLTDIMYTLRQTKLATVENIEIVIVSMKNNLLSSDTEDHFLVSKISPNKDCKDAIKESIIERAVDEDVPYSEQEISTYVEELTFKFNPDDKE
jgi:hypothetical protein